MRQDKDRTAKWLLAHHGDSILRLAGMKGFTSWRALQSENVAPRRLPDGLLEVQFEGDRDPTLVLVEVESYPGNDVDRQVLEDLEAVHLARGIVPEAICLVLRPKGQLTVRGTLESTSWRNTTKIAGSWTVVRLWDLEAADLLATGDPGLIPWVPLARSDRPADELLAECRDRIAEVVDERDRSGLKVVTTILAGLAFPGRKFLNLFGGAEKMIESPVLDELVELIEKRAEAKILAREQAKMAAAEEARRLAAEAAEEARKLAAEAETKAAARQATLLASKRSLTAFLEARFQFVPDAVREQIDSVDDVAKLDSLVRLAATCPDVDAFAAGLSGA